jgi:hypothetical protein
MTREEKLQIINNAVEYYKNSTIYLERKYNIYTTKFAALKSGKNGEG